MLVLVLLVLLLVLLQLLLVVVVVVVVLLVMVVVLLLQRCRERLTERIPSLELTSLSILPSSLSCCTRTISSRSG